MEGTYLSIEDAKTIENYDKLYAENTMLKSNELNFKKLINSKNKLIDEQRKKIKELEDKISSLISKNEQIDIFGGHYEK